MTAQSAFPELRQAHVVAIALVLGLLAASAARLDLFPLGASRLAEPPASGSTSWAGQMWPLQLSERRVLAPGEASPVELPPFASVQSAVIIERQIDPDTLRQTSVSVRKTWIVQPLGYAGHVANKLLETVEIAVWGTLAAILIAAPLSLLAASPVRMPGAVQAMARAVCALLRAIPELISALFLVAALGFGPLAGIVALGLHAAGFLGRFYADAIEDADQRPVDAIWASGAGRLASVRFGVIPQITGPAISTTLYILDRNVRMATVIGVVGAGGIGQELKGRMDTFEYHHVATILCAILIVVLLLDRLATRLRRRIP